MISHSTPFSPLPPPAAAVVVWVSKHGNACATGTKQYPGVSIDAKRAFWQQFETLFADTLIDTTVTPVNTTSLALLDARGTRLLALAADWVEFTDSSRFALDSCASLDNQLPDVLVADLGPLLDLWAGMDARRRRNARANRFSLVSMAASAPTSSFLPKFLAEFLPAIGRESNLHKCAAGFGVPVMNASDWCPPCLQDVSQLTNYVGQIAFRTALAEGWTPPNAVYLDAVDANGAIRTGTELFGLTGGGAAASDPAHATTAFAYVETMLLLAVRRVCGTSGGDACAQWTETLQQRCDQRPYARWDDGTHGRLVTWPLP